MYVCVCVHVCVCVCVCAHVHTHITVTYAVCQRGPSAYNCSHGTCIESLVPGEYTCDCDDGYTGKSCDTTIGCKYDL